MLAYWQQLIKCILMLAMVSNSAWARDRLAVLDVKASADGAQRLKPFEVKTLTSDLRRLALEYGGFDVMTDKNIIDLLPENTKIEDCIGECEVQTGRMLGAKYIITGEVGRAGGRLDMLVQFYETTGGTLLSSKSIGGQSYDQLRRELKLKVPSLFKGLAMRSAFVQQRSETLLFLRVAPQTASFRVKLGSRYIDLNDPSIKRLDNGVLIPMLPNIKQRLSVIAKGYMNAEEEILVKEGGVENISITLSKALQQKRDRCAEHDKKCSADVFVYSTPAGARIYVDGRPALDDKGQQMITEAGNPDQPNLGMSRLTVSPGEHLIEARKPRFVSAQRRVTLKRGDWYQDMQSKPLVLQEDFGRLIIDTEPKSVVIEMDGELIGQRSPLTLNEAEVGAHKLKLIAPEYLPHEEVVVVKRGQDKRLKVRLTPAFSSLELSIQEPSGQPIKGVLVNIDSLGSKGQKYTDAQGLVSYSRLPKGEYLALISHRLYLSSKLTIVSQSGGRTQSLSQSLSPNYGYLSVKAPDDPKQTYSSVPVQGQVYLGNGQLLGSLPLARHKLTAGRQKIRIQPKDTEHYSPQDVQVTIGIGEESKLKATLEPRVGEVVIETKPFGAEVLVNGESWGRAPLKKEVLRGRYQLQLSIKNYDTYTQEFEVLEDERVNVKVNLGQNPVITVRCHPAQAQIWIDGLPKGPSPQTHSARAGEWLLECRQRGAVYQKREVTKDGEVRSIHLTIPQARIASQRQQTKLLRGIGWSLLSSGALGALSSGVMYVGPAANTADERDRAYQSFLSATPDQYDERFGEFSRLDNEVKDYNELNQTIIWSSVGLSLIGGAMLWLIPPAVQELDPQSDTKSSDFSQGVSR